MYTSKARDLINVLEALSSGTKRGLKYGAGAVGAAGAGALAYHVNKHGLDNTIEQIKHLTGFGKKTHFDVNPKVDTDLYPHTVNRGPVDTDLYPPSTGRAKLPLKPQGGGIGGGTGGFLDQLHQQRRGGR